MIELMDDSKDGIVGVKVSGKLTAADYEQYLIPALDRVFALDKRARFLVLMDETFEGWTLDAAWDDASYWFQHRSEVDRVAIVGAPQWVEWCINAMRFALKGEFRLFERDRLDDAWAWLRETSPAS
jgi:hypothetical protein